MTDGLIFTLQYSNEKSCSVQTNLANWRQNYIKSDNLLDFDIIKLISNNSIVGYFHLSPVSRTSPHCNDAVYLNGLFASKIGFRNNTKVSGELLKNVSVCVKAWIEPVTVDDWEILEIHAEQVENSLLDQTRVLWPGQVFPLWISGSVCIFLRTATLEPNSECGILMPLTELIIEPKVDRSSTTINTRQLDTSAIPAENTISKTIKSEIDTKNVIIPVNNDEEQSHESRQTIFRRFLQISIVRKFLRLLSYIYGFLRNRLVPMLTSPFNMGLFRAIPAAVNQKTDSTLSENILLSIKNYPDKLCMVLRVEPMQCKSSHKNGSILAKFDQAGYVLLNAATHSKRDNVKENCCQSGTSCDENDSLDIGFFLVALQKLQIKKNESNAATNQENEIPVESDIVVRLCVQSLSNFAMILHNDIDNSLILEELTRSIKVSSVVRRQLDIGISSKVSVRKLKNIPKNVNGNITKIIFHILDITKLPGNITANDLQNSFETWLGSVADADRPLPIAVRSIFSINVTSHLSTQNACFDNSDGDLKIDIMIEKLCAEDETGLLSGYFLLCPDDLKTVKFEFMLSKKSDVTNVKSLDIVDPKIPQEGIEGLLKSQNEVVSNLIKHGETVFQSRPISSKLFSKKKSFHPGCVLITGPRGTGKTAISKALLRKFALSDDHYAYVHWISCSNLKGKKPETIKKLIINVIHELQWRQPSALLLDDLDHLIPGFESPDGDRSPNAIYALQLAAVLKDALSMLCRDDKNKCNRVLVIATAISEQSIHPLLLPSHGCYLFSKIMTLQLPDADERSEVLRSILSNDIGLSRRALTRIDVDEISQSTEGYSQKDFVQLTKRAVLSSKRRVFNKPPSFHMTTEDYLQATVGFVPISLQDANLHKPNKMAWCDIGGLHDVRKQLKEKLIWPMKYAHLYKTAGMHLQSGILLYGPPGCGKTLLAGVLANECNLNFISVKGPELLSKYIGASEAAVRELFTRASAAAPCILFFDEFDSIAQKRGHDSTGVTDRVVNQILTHLDGVEPLSGVYVLAATSRPDLIDPALLRPGRLDTYLQISMPDLDNRCDILKSLLSKVSLSDEVNIRAIAVRCEHFTGADLRALVYDAQLKALHGQSLSTSTSSTETIHDKSQSAIPDSPIVSSPEMELYEEYSSNGIKSIHHDLKEEARDVAISPANFKKTVNNVTKTAKKLVETIQNGDSNLLNVEGEQYNRICYGISSSEYSSDEYQNGENHSSVNIENEDIKSIYFPSLCSKTNGSNLPEDVQQIVQNLMSSTLDFQNGDVADHTKSTATTITVASYHLEMALECTGPSVSSSERKRYLEICRNFSGKSSDKSSDSAMFELRKHQRATLA